MPAPPDGLMNKRPTLRLRPSPTVASLSILDAAFITLLFVLAAASFLQIPLETLTPFAKAEAAEPPARIVVWVHEGGALDVNGHAVRPDELTPRLQALVAQRPEVPVEVVMPAGADLREVARTLEAARASGAPGVTVTRIAG